MSVPMTMQVERGTFLRRVLQANGVFSGLAGLAFIFDAGPIASFLGIQTPLVLSVIGVGLLLYAAALFYNAAREPISHQFAAAAVMLDSLWVLGSIILLLTDWVTFTLAGKWAIGIIADMVAVFAILQFIGLRRK